MSPATEHAERWIAALTSDTEALVDLYADELVFNDRAESDCATDTVSSKDALRAHLTVFANKDPDSGAGVHTFTATEVFALAGVDGNPAVVILWNWIGVGLATYRGVPAGGRTLSTRGITWHGLDDGGRITREITYWNDTPVLQDLGLPIVAEEYWVEGSDAG